jgi:peptidoglycan/LPS O-acetylase OafA/YrhL
MRAGTMLPLVAIAVCLFLGFWAFVYQGYTEDAGSEPTQSWPYGVALFLAAGAVAFVQTRSRRPDLTGVRLLGVAVVLLVALAVAALLSLDAGGHSFEF